MLKAMLAVAAAFVVSASSAFTAVTYHRDNSQCSSRTVHTTFRQAATP
jgi:hypothetical protein